MWAVGRRPGGPRPEPQPRRQTSRPLDVDRLRASDRRRPRRRHRRSACLRRRLRRPPDRPTDLGADRPRGRPGAAGRSTPARSSRPSASPTFYARAQPEHAGRRARRPALARAARPSFRQSADPRRTRRHPAEDPGLHRRKARASSRPPDAAQRPAALPAVLEPPSSPYTLIEGTLLPAILTAGIHSDLPGQTTALIRANVYDSLRGRHLLIPSGTSLLGAYDHRVAWGQRRVLVAWHRLIFPDGSSLDLGGMPGADLAGAGRPPRPRRTTTSSAPSAPRCCSRPSPPAPSSRSRRSPPALGQAASARQVVAAALGQEINRTATQILRRNLAGRADPRDPPGLRVLHPADRRPRPAQPVCLPADR